jgi:hypothetical protein
VSIVVSSHLVSLFDLICILFRNVATCFDEAITAYQYMPEVAAEVRRGAVLCRQQLTESTKMLRKVSSGVSMRTENLMLID